MPPLNSKPNSASTVSPAMIKELRARTGAGMMDCKIALVETAGDMDKAAAELRKKDAALAAKKSGRIAAEGIIALAENDSGAALVEINCETDFVANDKTFTDFAANISTAILTNAPPDNDALSKLKLTEGTDVESARQTLIGKVGEHISIRRFAIMSAKTDSNISVYLHGNRIGGMVLMRGGTPQLGHDVAMHIAASAPLCISEQHMPAATLESERAIYRAQAEQSGKPAAIVEKMIAGRVKKFLKENTLLGQPFVKKPEQSVGELLGEAVVEKMVRFEVGEGLEKRSDDFVAEVMAQAHSK